jgi:hypothetical protein
MGPSRSLSTFPVARFVFRAQKPLHFSLFMALCIESYCVPLVITWGQAPNGELALKSGRTNFTTIASRRWRWTFFQKQSLFYYGGTCSSGPPVFSYNGKCHGQSAGRWIKSSSSIKCQNSYLLLPGGPLLRLWGMGFQGLGNFWDFRAQMS